MTLHFRKLRAGFVVTVFVVAIFFIWTHLVGPIILLVCLDRNADFAFKTFAAVPSIADQDAAFGGGVFHATIIHNDRECFEHLLRHANINRLDDWGIAPLHIAASSPHGDYFLQRLIEEGADINQSDEYGRSPLDVAKAYENFDLEEKLRNHGGIELSPSVGTEIPL